MTKYYFFLLLIGSLLSCKQEPKVETAETKVTTTAVDTAPRTPASGLSTGANGEKMAEVKAEDVQIGLSKPQVSDANAQKFIDDYEKFIHEFNLAANKKEKEKCIEMGKKVQGLNKDAYALTAKLSGSDQQKAQEYFDSKSHYLLLLMTSTR